MSLCLTRNRIWFVTWDRNLVAFMLLVENAVVILAYQFFMAYPVMDLSVMRFKVYFGVSSRSKLIKFLFSQLFCKNWTWSFLLYSC